MNNNISLDLIINFLKLDQEILKAFPNVLLSGVGSTNLAKKHELTFIDKKRDDKLILFKNSKSKVILVDESFKNIKRSKNKILLVVQDPKLSFVKIYNKFFKNPTKHYIHDTVIIHPEAKISNNVTIEANCVIGKSVIGSGTVLKSNVIIGDNIKIGMNVLINSGCVLGSDGYGYIREKNNFPIQFPHIGGIVIEDFVDIGSNSCIDNGSLTPTIIQYGSKIDNLVHIGHNVNIGKCVFVAANSSIGGSSIIGDNSEIWMRVSIADGTIIGDNCSIGMGSVVIKNIPSNKKCFGNPARIFNSKL